MVISCGNLETAEQVAHFLKALSTRSSLYNTAKIRHSAGDTCHLLVSLKSACALQSSPRYHTAGAARRCVLSCPCLSTWNSQVSLSMLSWQALNTVPVIILSFSGKTTSYCTPKELKYTLGTTLVLTLADICHWRNVYNAIFSYKVTNLFHIQFLICAQE